MAGLERFSEYSADSDPFIQFDRWYREHCSHVSVYPDSFSLATTDDKGSVSVRTVLLKYHGPDGFVFFTNYESRKGNQLSVNPYAAMLFFWPESSQQVRIEGKAEKTSEKESEEYFRSRPRESRIGAWASRQDSIIPGRDFLEMQYREFGSKFMDTEVPRPPYWGGFRIRPSWFEFWQEGEHRLHDRIAYTPENNGWKKYRLSP